MLIQIDVAKEAERLTARLVLNRHSAIFCRLYAVRPMVFEQGARPSSPGMAALMLQTADELLRVST